MGGSQSPAIQSDTWLTPPWIIEALGPFDLDPCAAPEEAPWRCATREFRRPDDGLALPWLGRVWLNPPSNRFAGAFIDRLALHGQGTALIHARTETQWFQTIWQSAAAILFIRGRITFHRLDGSPARANRGAPCCLAAFGARDLYALERACESGKIKGTIVSGFNAYRLESAA
jgi:hypothetical protein